MLYLPDPGTWPVTPKEVLKESAKNSGKQYLSLAAANAPLRVIFGTVIIAPQIANAVPYNGGSVMHLIWGQGEIDSVVELYLNDVLCTLTATHYRGTASPSIDPTLVLAFAAQSPAITYTDTLPYVSHSVVVLPAGSSSGFPRFTAKIKGMKVYDPRSDSTNGGTGTQRLIDPTTWAHSDNPAICTANFVLSDVYGMNSIVDWASAAVVADDNDSLVLGVEKSRTLNLALENVQTCKSWLDTLRTYASCWVFETSSGVKFVSDKAGSSVASYSHSAGNILKISNIKKRGILASPTVMIVTYKDVSSNSPRDATSTVVIPGAPDKRESRIPLPGITRFSQAGREATERLNKLYYNDLSFTLSIRDEGLKHEIGDIIDVTDPFYGFSAKLMRVMSVTGSYGRFDLGLLEYDPAVYCSTVVAGPTYADTVLPNPALPPAVTGVTMAEEVYKLESGVYSSRWRVTWTAATYSYLSHYRAELWQGSTLILSGAPTSSEWATSAVQEDKSYTVKIAAVSSIGAVGSWGTQSASALGKMLAPSDVASITAFEAGGAVYASWPAAVDIDLWRYEVRYGAVGVPWASALTLDRVDALRLQSDQIPVGTWTLHVKALDSVGNYSAGAATCNVIVTSDASAFLVSKYNQTAPTLTGMAEYALARTDTNRYFVTEDGATVASKFTAALSTYGNVMATYHASITSTWLGESEDYWLDLGGQWTGTATVTDVSGSHISYFGSAMAATPGTWVYTAGLSQKLNARFARMKHESLTTSTMKVTIPTQEIRLDAIPREEVITGTSLSTGPLTVTLVNAYVAVKKLTITPLGTTARSAVADNITFVGSVAKFDVYIFDNTGTKMVSPFRAEWQGV